jgi:hypothetical protein
VKRSSKRADTSGGRIRFAEVDSAPVDMPEWLTRVSEGKATTVTAVHPLAIGVDDEDDEEEEEDLESIPHPVYVPHTRAANDAHVEVAPPRKETAPPVVPSAPVRRSEIPRPPKAPDTLIDELIPRADEEAAAALAGALEEFAGARARLLSEAEGDLFALTKAIAERVVARELRSDPRVVTQLVREGLSALSAGDACTVRLGRFFSGVVDDVRRAVGDIAMDVTVVVDPTLPTYGCVVESQWGRVDESVDARLRTLLDQLDAMRVRTGGE